MLNSFFIAACSAVLTTYFSALTAYGIHVYNFRLKKFAFYFIMAVMMIPPQVSAVGFIQLVYKFHLTNSYIPLILPSIAAPVVFFYMKQYLESVLPMEMVEAARMDGSGEFRTFNRIGREEDRPHHDRPAQKRGLLQVRHGQGVHVHPAGHPAGHGRVHHPLQVHHQGRHRRLRQGLSLTKTRNHPMPSWGGF